MINESITNSNIGVNSSAFGELFEFYFIKGIIHFLLNNKEYSFELNGLEDYLNKYLNKDKSNKILNIEKLLINNNLYNDDIGKYIILEGFSFLNKIKLESSKVELVLFNDLADDDFKIDKNTLLNSYFKKNNENFEYKNFAFKSKDSEKKGHFINSDLMFVFKGRKKRFSYHSI